MLDSTPGVCHPAALARPLCKAHVRHTMREQECQRLVGTASAGQWATPSFQCKVLVHTLLSGNRSSVDSVLQVRQPAQHAP